MVSYGFCAVMLLYTVLRCDVSQATFAVGVDAPEPLDYTLKPGSNYRMDGVIFPCTSNAGVILQAFCCPQYEHSQM